MSDSTDTTYISAAEAAKRLGVHRNTVLLWVREGILKSARLPGARTHRFDERDVGRLLRQRGAAVASVVDGGISVGPELVSGGQLSEWAKTQSRDAQEKLPELVGDLLLASGGVTVTSMPSGDGVGNDGWDGVANVETSRFLPRGPIGFEIGSGADFKSKAQSDYQNRTNNPLGLNPAETTFVFVTPHRWKDSASWLAKKRTDNIWRDVLVVDADELERWLRAAPAVHIRISEHLGRSPRHAQTLGAWWERYRTQTDPPLPLAVFAAGRADQSKALLDFLDAPSGDAMTIKSTWLEDVYAFVHGVVAGIDGQDEHSRVPVVLVDTPKVWDDLVAQPGGVILMPTFDQADLAAATAAGHRVILAAARDHVVGNTAIKLPKPSRSEATKAFEEAGVENEAHLRAGLARRSLPSLVRVLARDPRHKRPPWAQDSDGSLAAVLTLAGSWTGSDGDHEVVARLSGRSWEEVEARLIYWETDPDRPFVRSATTWQVASPEDAFRLTGECLAPAAIARWHEVCRDVLLEQDPLAGLEDVDRLTAQFRGVGRKYSGTLRLGLARGAALLGSLETVEFADNTAAPTQARLLVHNLLGPAAKEPSGKAWCDLSDVLPLLAEAAPETFLEIVHAALDENPSPLAAMFQDQESTGFFGPSSPHTHLLWALEALCWSNDYLIDGTRALARLDRIDQPRGRLGNRPIRSLGAILVPWVRHTSATYAVRVQALDAVSLESQHTAWDLVMALWPSHHSTSSPPSSPRFRDWKPDSKNRLVAEVWDYTDHVVGLGMQLCANDPGRWTQLIERLGTIRPADRTKALAALSDAIRTGSIEGDNGLLIWRSLRDTVAHHRAFPDADWSMDAPALEELDATVAEFEPTAAADRLAHLFDWRPDVIDVPRSDYAAYNAALEQTRRDAIEAIFRDDGIDGLARLARRSPQPHLAGLSAVGIPGLDGRHRSVLISWLGSEERALSEFARTWASGQTQEPGWLASALADPSADTPACKIQLALGAVTAASTWATVEAEDPALLDRYWQVVRPVWVRVEDLATALSALVDHGQPVTAIQLAAHDLHRHNDEPPALTIDLARSVLDGLLAAKDLTGQVVQNLGYDVGLILDYLKENGSTTAELALYEFALYHLLEDYRNTQALDEILATEPAQFVQLLAWSRGIGPESEGLSGRAWSVLEGWRRVPGMGDAGVIDVATLVAWITNARALLAEADLADLGDEKIGAILANTPPSADGVWPQESIRDLIELIGNARIETGVYLGRVNGRGVTTRDPYSGGEGERSLAARYREWTAGSKATHRRTSKILRRLAESYEHDAREEDQRAEFRQDMD